MKQKREKKRRRLKLRRASKLETNTEDWKDKFRLNRKYYKWKWQLGYFENGVKMKNNNLVRTRWNDPDNEELEGL